MRAHVLLALAFAALAVTGGGAIPTKAPANAARYSLLYIHSDGNADIIDAGLTLSDCASKSDATFFFCELQKN